MWEAGFSCMWFTRHVTSKCNLSSLIYKALESTLFLFLPLTKLPHPDRGFLTINGFDLTACLELNLFCFYFIFCFHPVFAWLVRNRQRAPRHSRGAWRYCLGHRVLSCMTYVVNFVFALSQLQGVEWGWPGRGEPDDEHYPAS